MLSKAEHLAETILRAKIISNTRINNIVNLLVGAIIGSKESAIKVYIACIVF